jgi:hypothetical protein
MRAPCRPHNTRWPGQRSARTEYRGTPGLLHPRDLVELPQGRQEVILDQPNLMADVRDLALELSRAQVFVDKPSCDVIRT